jgi:hypothetical protein
MCRKSIDVSDEYVACIFKQETNMMEVARKFSFDTEHGGGMFLRNVG